MDKKTSDPQAREADSGRKGGGDSGGGAYPNPHEKSGEGGFTGGQSDKAYHGHGRLGEKTVGGNANAPARTKSERDDGRGD
jgi:hypothetical protein